LRSWSAGKKHTGEARGDRRDPGVRVPGAGRGQRPARSKIFLVTMFALLFSFAIFIFRRVAKLRYILMYSLR